jgi:hypothetical protein
MTSRLSRSSTLLAILALAPAAAAGTLYVDAGLTTGANNGSSWADAFRGPDGLQAALAVASAGDQVFAAQGTYRPSSTGNRSDSFRPINDVEIYGGFLGTESSPAQRPAIGTAPSIMSADLNGDDSGGANISDNSYHLIRGAGVNPSAVIDGFTITGGNANLSSANENKGGGILCGGGSSPTVRHCLFTGNRCTFGGGAGYVTALSAPSFFDCQFVNNSGGSYGGAFDVAQGGAVLWERCSFTGNSAARAGALEFFATQNIVVSNCEFIENTSTGSGGGGALWMGSGGSSTIRNCSIVDNHAPVQGVGGIRNQGSNVTVSNTIIWNNTGAGGASGSTNQVTASTAVTWSLVQGGFTGTGNVSSDPLFTNQAGGDLTLTGGSPAIDAGNNSLAGAGVTLDLARNPRFSDEPGVPDTGSGTAPIADMGALEVTGSPVTVFCAGDGTGAACPCSNTGDAGSGCGNGSFSAGAELSGTGTPSVSSDTLTLHAARSTPLAPGIFFQGDDILAGGAGVAFGDGLMCTGTNIRRIEVVFADGAGNASSTLSIAVKCDVLAGETKRMQWWYRDVALSPCGNNFNVSNGVETVWVP